MAATHDPFLDLAGMIYDAAIEPTRWPQVAEEASRAFEAPFITLGVVGRDGNEVMRAATQGVGELNLSGYMTPETNPGLAFSALTPPTTVELRDRMVPDFGPRAIAVLPGTHATVRFVACGDCERASRRTVLAPMGLLRGSQGAPLR